jgi:hypothetical protein
LIVSSRISEAIYVLPRSWMLFCRLVCRIVFTSYRNVFKQLKISSTHIFSLTSLKIFSGINSLILSIGRFAGLNTYKSGWGGVPELTAH